MNQKESTKIEQVRVFGTPVAAIDTKSLTATLLSWVKAGERGKLITFTNVHVIVEGLRNEKFQALMRETDINCPDGMPVAWYIRRIVGKNVRRVCGPDFLPSFCKAAADMELRHFFYGGAEGVAEKAAEALKQKIPNLQLAGVYAPPFRPLTPEEDEEVVSYINSTKPDVVWACLGCPKQEMWIAEHRNKLDVPVLLAVGQALDIAAGVKKRAPRIFCATGFEWLYRLCQEPGRLWRRYLIYNSIFLYHLLTELFSLPPALRSASTSTRTAGRG